MIDLVKCRLGIIGFGRIGAEHARWIRSAGIEIAGVFDPTLARLQLAERDGLVTCDSLEALCSRASAVLVATPTSMHFDHAMHAIRAGKHVMVEKPMTTSFEQAQTLLAVAHEHKRVLSVFHNRRWDVDFLTLRQAIQSGTFGRIFNVESRLGQWASCVGPAAREWRPQWRTEAAFGGGALFDWGSHFIDQIWQLLLPARPQRVFAQLRSTAWSSDCDDLARICIDFDSGAVGLIELNTTTTLPLPRWHVDGEKGSASAPFSGTFDMNEWAQFKFISAAGDERALMPANTGLNEVEIWSCFAKACEMGSDPAVTAQTVLPTMALLDAARRSSATGQAVDVLSSLR